MTILTGSGESEVAWPSGLGVGLEIQRTWVQVPLGPLAEVISQETQVELLGHS